MRCFMVACQKFKIRENTYNFFFATHEINAIHIAKKKKHQPVFFRENCSGTLILVWIGLNLVSIG